MQLPSLPSAALETAINRVLAADPVSRKKLASMSGKVIGLHITGINLKIYVLPNAGGVSVLPQLDREPDAWLIGGVASWIHIGMGGDSVESMLRGDIEMRGDHELGHQLKQFLDGLNLEWEELLAPYLGDVIAHSAGRMLNTAASWFTGTGDNLARDMGEYLKEEACLSPATFELKEFVRDTDRLRDDVERLAARIELLRGRLQSADDHAHG